MSRTRIPFRNSSLLTLLLYGLPIGLGLIAAVLLPIFTHDGDAVVVYTALDREFSEPIFDEFTRQTGIRIAAKYDTESTKTIGLTQALLAEQERPRCDLFWNNEIVNTLRLDQVGLLASYPAMAADAYPTQFRSPKHAWHGFASRARVLLVNTDLVAGTNQPSSIFELVNPAWQNQVGIAKPLAGTTASHAACLFAVWGEQEAKQYFAKIKQNCQVMAGNKQVALAVAQGELAFGLTDTDDALIELEKGMPVKIVYPDQKADELGTLFIPNTLALIKDSPNPESAQKLVEFLLSPRVERMLAHGPSAQIPLNPAVQASARVETPQTVRAMVVDFQQAAAQWKAAATFLRDEFASAD